LTAEAGKCTLARNRGLTLVDLMRPTCALRLEVTSSILLNLSRGMRLPVGVEMFGDPVHDPFRRFGVGEDPHRPRPPADLPEPPFQDVGGANRLPGCSREREEVEAVEQVLLQTADSRLRLIELLGPPHLEPPERLGPGGRAEDQLRLAHAGFALGPLQLHHDVPQFVGNAPLQATERAPRLGSAGLENTGGYYRLRFSMTRCRNLT
jgi:hypothetical protein